MAGGKRLSSSHVRLTGVVKGRLHESKTNRSQISAERRLAEAERREKMRSLSSEARQIIAEIALEAGATPDHFASEPYDLALQPDDDHQWTDDEDNSEDNQPSGVGVLERSHEEPGIEQGRRQTWQSLEFHHHLSGSRARRTRVDERTRLQRNRVMYAAWDSQTPALVEAYLEYKYPRIPSTYPVDHVFTVDSVDILERKYSHPIHQMEDEFANCALLRAGFLGAAPTRPQTAFSLNCLELYHQIRRRQSSFSIQAMAKVLCALHNVTYSQVFCNQLSVAFDIYLSIVRNVQKCVDCALGRDRQDWRLQYACPPCGYKLQDEPPLFPARLHAMDGNNSMKRVDGSGHADECIFHSDYHILPQQVDFYKDDVRKQTSRKGRMTIDGASPCDSDLTACADHWQAANGGQLDRLMQVFEQCGGFISACRHGLVETLIEMNHSGELAKYGLATLDKLMQVCKQGQGVGYDIGCSFRGTVMRSSLAQRAEMYSLTLAVNAFHGHAHNRLCQLKCHPMYLRGFGLEDLETCERIFSSSNSVARLIRFSSHFHWVQFLDLHFQQWDQDKYLELSSFIFNNYRQALRVIREYTPHIARLQHDSGITDADFESWHAAEIQYLESLQNEPESHLQAVAYVEALQKLERARAVYGQVTTVQFRDYVPADFHRHGAIPGASQARDRAQEAERRAAFDRLELTMNAVDDLERRMGITTRWRHDSQEYQETSTYIANRQWIRVVEKLEGLVVQRLFEMAKANLASTGYKLRKHIARAIIRRSAAVKTALDQYNQLAPLQVPPRPLLAYSDLAEYASLGEFELLKTSRRDVLDKPWALAANREVAIMYFKVSRAREEIQRLNVESRRLWTWVDDEDRAMLAAIEAHRWSDPHLAGAIRDCYKQRHRVNNMHRSKLRTLQNLHGYSGAFSSGLAVSTPNNAPGTREAAVIVVPEVEEAEPLVITILPDEDDALLDESLRYETFVSNIQD